MRMNAATNGALRILMVCRPDRLLTMPDMSAMLGLADALVVKSCHALMQAGYLDGQRGRGGGYRLARPAADIRVLDIIDLFEPEENLFPCRLSTDRQCRIVTVCKLRRACEAAHSAFRAELADLTIATLALDQIAA